jgi:RHS repeat-associated protein
MDYFTCNLFATADVSPINPASGEIADNYGPDAPFRKKLRLLSITEESCGNSIDPKLHRFSYFDPDFSEYSYAPRMPHRFSYAQDHWGYFNGKGNETFLSDCPKEYFNSTSNNWDDDVNGGSLLNYNWLADRSPSEAHTKAGILKEITYPTGGKTLFEYELNDFRNTYTEEYNVQDITVSSCQPGNGCQLCVDEGIIEIPNQTLSIGSGERYELEVTLRRVNSDHGFMNCSFADFDMNVQVSATWNFDGSTINIGNLGLSGDPSDANYSQKTVVFDIPGTNPNINYYSNYTFVCRKIGVDYPIMMEMTFREKGERTVTHNVPVGGLRIKRIAHDPISSIPYEENFEYTIGANSITSGELLGFPQYFAPAPVENLQENELQAQVHLGPANGSWNNVAPVRSYYSSSRGNMATTQGYHIGYKEVKMGKTNNGYVQNKYHIIGNPRTFYAHDFPLSPTWYDDMLNSSYNSNSTDYNTNLNGLIKESSVFNAQDDLVKKTEFLYEVQTLATSLNRLFARYDANYTAAQMQQGTARTYYRLKSTFIKQVAITETIDGLTNTTFTSYRPDLLHTLPIETKKINSDGTEHISRMKYVGDLECQTYTCASSSDMMILDGMIAQNMVHLPLEQTTLIKKMNQTEKVIASKLIAYNNFGTSNAPIYKPLGFYLFRPQIPHTGFTSVARAATGNLLSDSNYETDLQYVFDYDNDGNQLSAQKKDDVQQNILWGNNGTYPIATIINGNFSHAAYTSFENNDLGGWSHNGSILQSGFGGGSAVLLENQAVSRNVKAGDYVLNFWQKSGTATVIVNGIIQESFQSQNTEYIRRQLIIPANNMLNTIEVRGTNSCFIDEVRLHPKNAQMKTYRYDNVTFNMVSAGDINNTMSFYEYDELNRLSEIHDFEGNILSHYEYELDPMTGINAVRSYVAKTDGFSQTNDLVNASNEDVLKTINYVDGLGRPLQDIVVGQSFLGKDIIQMHEFDELNRTVKSYLPFTFNSNGTFLANAKIIQQISKGGFAYSEIDYEASPLNRPLATSSPGNAWKLGSGHEKTFITRSNLANEVFHFDGFGNGKGYYNANSLQVSIRTDENGNTSITYTNLLGQVIMTNIENAKTYYVYDDFGRLKFVIPPKAFNKMEMTGIYSCNANASAVYSYVYDNHFNVIRKNNPGKSMKRLYYDRLDRLVLVVDGIGNKTFKKYDVLSRQILSGIYNGSAIPANENLYEVESNGSFGYTLNNSFPSSSIDVLSATFYDHYDFDRSNALSVSELSSPDVQGEYDEEVMPFVLGAITGMKTAIIESKTSEIEGYMFNKNYFDEKLNLIQNKMINQTGETEVMYTDYNFQRLPLKSKRLHRANLTSAHSSIIEKEYEYDHAGRLLKEYHQIDNGAKQLVSEKTYTEEDLLKSNALGVDASGDYLQRIDYRYNIRNWLTHINGIDNSCNDQVELGQIGNSSSRSGGGISAPKKVIKELDLFSMQLNYENPLGSVTPQFNGNIAQISWQSRCGESINQYDFEYDNRNQLKTAFFNEGVSMNNMIPTGNFDVNVAYDLNGNIETLSRKSNSVLIDDLQYTYNDENHLINLEELSDLTDGFKSIQSSAGFQYDQNGNMFRDEHKGLTIQYNIFNLPSIIAYDNQDSIKIKYNGSGQKVAKLVKSHTASSWTPKYYFGEIEYSDDNVEAIYFADGRAVPFQGAWNYEYMIKDHLGNTRVMFSDLDGNGKIEEANGEVLQQNHYYPFGMKMNGPWSQVSGSENPYQYNGKEFNTEFGLDWLDYGARWYDPSIARWNAIDPLAEKFNGWSPYNYVMNNPINMVDPDGKEPGLPEIYRYGYLSFTRDDNGLTIHRMSTSTRKSLEAMRETAKLSLKLTGLGVVGEIAEGNLESMAGTSGKSLGKFASAGAGIKMLWNYQENLRNIIDSERSESEFVSWFAMVSVGKMFGDKLDCGVTCGTIVDPSKLRLLTTDANSLREIYIWSNAYQDAMTQLLTDKFPDLNVNSLAAQNLIVQQTNPGGEWHDYFKGVMQDKVNAQQEDYDSHSQNVDPNYNENQIESFKEKRRGRYGR